MQLISVIIPVYNAEQTIRRCLDSMLDSEYEEYEILLIDDGSTDNSVSILLEYARKNNRIKVYQQINSGPSVARNKGITLSSGEIIAFVDSDDYVESDYLSLIAKTFEEEKADVIFFEFNRVTSKGVIISNHKLPTYENEYYTNLISLSKNDMFGYTWIKAFRREIIGEKRFNEKVNLFEDEIFTCNVLENPVNVCFLNKAVYNYVREAGTLADRTRSNYCGICDMVYKAWRRLLSGNLEGEKFLEEKANHMAKNCKYYGLERKVNPLSFYTQLSECDFMKEATIQDILLSAVIKKKWLVILRIYLAYKAKISVAKIFKRNS